jgi:hypothetical protein
MDYPDPDLFDPATCPYCREARAAGAAACTRHYQPEDDA